MAPEASLEALAAAFARPMMRALAVGGRDLDVMRIVARAGIDPPQGWDRFDASFDRIRADVLRVLKANVPGVRDQELIFRTRCAAGLLNWLVLAPVGAELRNKSEKQIERRLVPVSPAPSAARAPADERPGASTAGSGRVPKPFQSSA